MPTKKTVKKTPVKQSSMEMDRPSIITIILLVFAYPIGWILMLLWTNWPKWVKWVISIPVIAFCLVLFAILLIAISGGKSQRMQKVKETKQVEKYDLEMNLIKRSCDKVCQNDVKLGYDYQTCLDECINPSPTLAAE